MGQNNTKWDKMQGITALVLASLTIAGIVLAFGEAKNKLETLEIGQAAIKIELQEIIEGLKNLQLSTYTKEDAERDFNIRDQLWEAKLNHKTDKILSRHQNLIDNYLFLLRICLAEHTTLICKTSAKGRKLVSCL